MLHTPLSTLVLGGGSWGTALAHLLAHAGHRVTLVVRHAEQATSCNAIHENSRYLPGLPLHPAVHAIASEGFLFEDAASRHALAEAELLVMVVPCQALRSTLERAVPFLSRHAVLVNAAKGIEIAGGHAVHEIVRQIAPDWLSRYSVLSGPSFAKEVMQSKPTAVVLGCKDGVLGARLREVFYTPWFRTYSSTDVIGVELGGALKNVIAIAAGVSDGLSFGLNARAALITRGLAEISRIGVAMGARQETFMGLSGIGDLTLTCSGQLSRNRQFGLRLGAGETTQEILASTHSVAEGVPTTQAICRIATERDVEMPIAQAMFSVLYAGRDPYKVVEALMARRLREE